MIPLLFHLWLATVYVAAYAVAVLLWNHRNRPSEYAGRHRTGEERSPYVQWMDSYRARVQHWIATHAPETDTEVLLRLDDTQWDLPPVVDGPPDVTRYDKSAGSQHYQGLKDIPLQVGVEQLFTRTESLPLRGAAPMYAEISDEMYAEVAG